MKRRDDPFARRLREAGAALTPPTSDALHACVMADVRRERALASSAAPRARWAVARWWMIGATAAAIAVGIGLWMTSREGVTPLTPLSPRPQVAVLPPVPSIEAAVLETVEPVREKLHEARFAYLDRDAKRLARFLIRAVPGVATDPKEPAGRS
jgi:hypothetical protein